MFVEEIDEKTVRRKKIIGLCSITEFGIWWNVCSVLFSGEGGGVELCFTPGAALAVY